MSQRHCVEITASGAVRLGPDVVCDGFYDGVKARVQTHVHADHLSDFETSKGYQDIITSSASYDLLVLLKNADLPYRTNFHRANFEDKMRVADSLVTLLPRQPRNQVTLRFESALFLQSSRMLLRISRSTVTSS